MLLLTFGVWNAAAAKTTKESVTSGGVPRSYYLSVPDKAPDAPMPLIVLLHGSGRDGKSLLASWEKLADKEKIILIGAEATVREGWGMRDDGPHFLYDLVESVNKAAWAFLEQHALSGEPKYQVYDIPK